MAAGVVVDVAADAPEGAHSAPGPEGATKPPPPEADAGESSEAAAPTGTDIEAEGGGGSGGVADTADTEEGVGG